MTLVRAYAATGPARPLGPADIERRALRDGDVAIEIRYCGICHSDIHQANEDWGPSMFPMVPGHEISGIVADLGPGVGGFAVGDRVGVGCFVDSCRQCENCLIGQEEHCLRGEATTYNGRFANDEPTFGGYSQSIVVDEHYVLRLPDTLELDVSAPLLCAGITVFSPLSQWGAGPGTRVAVVGLGGLGHLATKIASAMGAEVSVLSQTLAKQDDGKRFGARDYYATNDPKTFDRLRNSFDLIIDTASATADLADYLSTLRYNGTLVLAGMPGRPFSLPVIPLVTNQRKIVGTKNGGIGETQEMLDFCGAHGIGAEVEVIPAAEINRAWSRLLDGKARYRYVIDTTTI